MYVLVLVLVLSEALGSRAVSVTQEFSSEKRCREAIAEIVGNLNPKLVNPVAFSCVRK